jgi:hypothetical protein
MIIELIPLNIRGCKELPRFSPADTSAGDKSEKVHGSCLKNQGGGHPADGFLPDIALADCAIPLQTPTPPIAPICPYANGSLFDRRLGHGYPEEKPSQKQNLTFDDVPHRDQAIGICSNRPLRYKTMGA